MYALSIRQPYAAAILAGLKRNEHRSWPTTHRGPLLIHAALSRGGLSDLWEHPALRRGALLGTVDAVGCERYRGEFRWRLRNPRAFAAPVPYKGRLGLWEVAEGVFAGQLAAK